MVLFWAATDMTEILNDCTVGDSSRVPSLKQWVRVLRTTGLFTEQAHECAGFDEATCWFRIVGKYADYAARMSVPIKDEKPLHRGEDNQKGASLMLNNEGSQQTRAHYF
jgi:hypothetical protein